MPPAKILIAAVFHEFEIAAVTDRRPIYQKVLQKDFVQRLLVIKSKLGRPHPSGRFGGIPAGAITKFKQPAIDLSHTAYRFNRAWRRRDGCVELIAQQVLDVVNQQLLVLHLALEPE